MRCGSRPLVLVLLVVSTALLSGESLSPVHQQRYSMGTMFDIIAYHASPGDASRAIEQAMAEIVRLDQVMSHFKEDSDLSRLNREGARAFVAVEPSLYDVIREAIGYSRRSGGRFDVTIASLLETWRKAHADGRAPAAGEIAAAMRCVGYGRIQLRPPNLVSFRSDCLELDLGGIGKGYAVDRAIAVLEAEGIRHALVNAGGSSIAAIGAPPGRAGWPVRLGTHVSGRDTLLLVDGSISTSQSQVRSLPSGAGAFGEILDPATGAPVEGRLTVSVVAPRATASDALSTALLMFPPEEGARLLEQFPAVAAIWMSPAGEMVSAFRLSRLMLAEAGGRP